jgi:hypothetical protein
MLNRRQALQRCANGFGAMALSALLAKWSDAATANERVLDPMKVRPPHFKAKAKSVIFLFMDGGVSHVDSSIRRTVCKKRADKSCHWSGLSS